MSRSGEASGSGAPFIQQGRGSHAPRIDKGHARPHPRPNLLLHSTLAFPRNRLLRFARHNRRHPRRSCRATRPHPTRSDSRDAHNSTTRTSMMRRHPQDVLGRGDRPIREGSDLTKARGREGEGNRTGAGHMQRGSSNRHATPRVRAPVTAGRMLTSATRGSRF